MEDFLPPTSPPLSQDQTENPNSSSSSFNYHFSFDDYQNYHLDFDDSFCNNHNPNHNPNPPCYQDSSSSNTHFRTDEQTPVLLEMTTTANTFDSSRISVDATYSPQPNNFVRDNLNGERVNDGTKVALRTRTELEVLDDGYKWRKYGKKKVKSNPNLRNYYKCLTAGCKVKKRVERDRDDSSYVIATYIGTHNHDAPSIIACNDTRPTGVWTLQLS